MGNVLAVLEQRGGVLKHASLETLTAARNLADASGGDVHAVVVGPAGIDLSQAGAYGADKIHALGGEGLELYQPDVYTSAIVDVFSNGDHSAVVIAATAMGKDLAPRIAGRLDCPLAADVIAVDGGDEIVVTRSLYAGKVLAKIKVVASKVVISVRPNVFTATENAKAGTVETGSVPEVERRANTAEIKAPESARLDVAEAPVVVAGGRGLKEAENFKLLEELAEAFGDAAIGASRAVVDAGWRPHADQVGQTGKTVSPPLYIAIGISGAIQHLAGMRTSQVIVAINKDPDAPIFKVADYGIVGDLFEVVPKLTEEVRKIREA